MVKNLGPILMASVNLAFLATLFVEMIGSGGNIWLQARAVREAASTLDALSLVGLFGGNAAVIIQLLLRDRA